MSAHDAQNLEWPHGTSATPERGANRHTSHMSAALFCVIAGVSSCATASSSLSIGVPSCSCRLQRVGVSAVQQFAVYHDSHKHTKLPVQFTCSLHVSLHRHHRLFLNTRPLTACALLHGQSLINVLLLSRSSIFQSCIFRSSIFRPGRCHLATFGPAFSSPAFST